MNFVLDLMFSKIFNIINVNIISVSYGKHPEAFMNINISVKGTSVLQTALGSSA
jgi:hypothetical protein